MPCAPFPSNPRIVYCLTFIPKIVEIVKLSGISLDYFMDLERLDAPFKDTSTFTI